MFWLTPYTENKAEHLCLLREPTLHGNGLWSPLKKVLLTHVMTFGEEFVPEGSQCQQVHIKESGGQKAEFRASVTYMYFLWKAPQPTYVKSYPRNPKTASYKACSSLISLEPGRSSLYFYHSLLHVAEGQPYGEYYLSKVIYTWA